MSVPGFALRLDERATRSDTYDDEMDDLSPFEAESGTSLVHHELLADDDAEGGANAEPERVPMDDFELKTVVQHEIEQSIGHYESELSANRIAAYRYSDGNVKRAPAGRSNAVSTDVADVIEWTVPQVVDGLLSTENVVVFEATSEDDEEQAQLEVDACEYVLHTENPGFLNIQSVIRDALLLKNGILKIYWEDEPEVDHEEYSGLMQQELQALMNPRDGSEVEITGHEIYESPPGPIDINTGQPAAPVPLFDVTCTRTRPGGRVVTMPIPLDEFLLNKDHPSLDLDKARFTAHKYQATRSDMIEQGWDYDVIMALPEWNADTDGEREERRRHEDEEGFNEDSLDPSMQLVWAYECYIRIDQNRDGVAELLQVHMAGDEAGLEMLGWEPVDSNPFVGGTGILVPHKFFGKSLFDRVWEIADQKTQILRQLQDNLSHQNNARIAVVAGQVNIDDLLTSRPGGIVRQKAPGMMEPLTAPQIGEWGYRHLDWLDSVRTGRAGVSPDTANVVESIAGDTAHGLERIMSAKEELTGLMIKMFANTFMTGAMSKIRTLLQRHRTTPMHFKRRGKWSEVDPSKWGNRAKATAANALSNGDRAKLTAAYNHVVSLQERAIQAGGLGTLVTEKNVYNAASGLVRSTPIGDPSPFFTDPESEEAQEARRAKQAEAEKAKEEERQAQLIMLQAQQDIEENKELTKRLKMQADAQEAVAKRTADLEKLYEELQARYTEMELKYAQDVPGQGMEDSAVPAEPASVLPEAWMQ